MNVSLHHFAKRLMRESSSMDIWVRILPAASDDWFLRDAIFALTRKTKLKFGASTNLFLPDTDAGAKLTRDK